MANGAFLGGFAQGVDTYRQQGLAERGVALQEKQLAFNQDQALLDRADAEIANTMGVIGSTIKGIAAQPDVGTGPGVWADAITAIESSGDYSLKGPVTKDGDRAYGRYQVMGANVGDWTEKALGTRMTPEQFLASPKAQDAVFNTVFGQYVQETGSPDRAALKWFTGRSDDAALALADQLGTTGAEYLQKFNEGVAGAPRAKVKAAVAPLLKDVTDIAGKVGKNPSTYVDMVNAAILAAPIGFDAALEAGATAAKTKIGERNALIRAGISKADAELTAGIKTVDPAVGLDPNQIATAESAMRNQYTGLSKDFTLIRDAYGRIQQSLSGTPAGDIALVFNYMKMLDPGSTVREGEFATAQNATGVPGQITNVFNQLLTGGRLNADQRTDFAGLAAKLLTAAQTQQAYTADQFRAIAKRTGLDPTNVVVDFNAPPGAAGAPAAAAGGPSAAATGAQEGSIAINPTTGAKLILQNGKWVPLG